jgi:hypothetical protein
METPAASKTFELETQSGAVTFLITDIEGSIKLLERLHKESEFELPLQPINNPIHIERYSQVARRPS